MGYTTRFKGEIKIDPPLSPEEVTALNTFADDRHGDGDVYPGFPSFYCQWVSKKDGTAIVWDCGEKFYEAEAWMNYIINHFLAEAHTLNGEIIAQGEDVDDRWKLVVKDNVVTKYELG